MNDRYRPSETTKEVISAIVIQSPLHCELPVVAKVFIKFVVDDNKATIRSPELSSPSTDQDITHWLLNCFSIYVIVVCVRMHIKRFYKYHTQSTLSPKLVLGYVPRRRRYFFFSKPSIEYQLYFWSEWEPSACDYVVRMEEIVFTSKLYNTSLNLSMCRINLFFVVRLLCLFLVVLGFNMLKIIDFSHINLLHRMRPKLCAVRLQVKYELCFGMYGEFHFLFY